MGSELWLINSDLLLLEDKLCIAYSLGGCLIIVPRKTNENKVAAYCRQ